MGKMKLLSGQKIMLDTAPLIYYIEDIEPYASSLQSLFDAISTGRNMAVTSVITLIEVLTKPIRDGRSDLAKRFRMYLTSSGNLELVSVTQEIGEQAAHLRAKYGMRIPDAIQVATALISGSSILLTNDKSLKKVMEVGVLIMEDVIEFEE